MPHPLNTPLGRFGIVTTEEGPQRCIASIPAGGMTNPLTDRPTVAALAMLWITSEVWSTITAAGLVSGRCFSRPRDRVGATGRTRSACVNSRTATR
jgi:hypothetical protein